MGEQRWLRSARNVRRLRTSALAHAYIGRLLHAVRDSLTSHDSKVLLFADPYHGATLR